MNVEPTKRQILALQWRTDLFNAAAQARATKERQKPISLEECCAAVCSMALDRLAEEQDRTMKDQMTELYATLTPDQQVQVNEYIHKVTGR